MARANQESAGRTGAGGRRHPSLSCLSRLAAGLEQNGSEGAEGRTPKYTRGLMPARAVTARTFVLPNRARPLDGGRPNNGRLCGQGNCHLPMVRNR